MLNQGQVQRRGPQGTTGTARAPEALNPRTTKSTSLSPAQREDGEADLRGAGASARRGGRGIKRLSKDVVMPTRPHSRTALSQAVRGSRQGEGAKTALEGKPKLLRPETGTPSWHDPPVQPWPPCSPFPEPGAEPGPEQALDNNRHVKGG